MTSCNFSRFVACFVLLLNLILLGALYGILYRLKAAEFMSYIVEDYTLMYEAIYAVFCLLYFLMFLWLCASYKMSHRLCTFNNIVFVIAGCGYVSMTSTLLGESYDALSAMRAATEQDCSQFVFGWFADMHNEYETSGKTFCSPQCPCNWAIHFDSSDANYDMAGAHNYQHCSEENVTAAIDPDHEKLFSQLEEKYFCAGLCANPGHFVFSNVNNGIPDATC